MCHVTRHEDEPFVIPDLSLHLPSGTPEKTVITTLFSSHLKRDDNDLIIFNTKV